MDIKVKPWSQRYFGVFLLSAATLMLQVSYTRVFSVALWYHFIWMIVSIALFGYAASGTFLTVSPKILKVNHDFVLSLTSILFSLSTLIGFKASSQIPFDPSRLAWDKLQILYISVYYLLFSIPFFLSGLNMAIAMTEAGSRINKLYFSSLVGSAFGSIIVLPLFVRLTGSGIIVFTSMIGGISALTFASNLRKKILLGIIGWMLLISLFLPFASNLFPVRISPYKSLMTALRYPEAELLDTRWNAFSRVDVVKSGLVRYAPGLSLQYKGVIPEQVGVTIDGESLNAITRYDGSESPLSFTGFLPISLPYKLVHKPNVLIIDSGGGLSVLTALHHNASRVVAVEVNPIIVELIREKYCEYSGSIYNDKKVQVVVDWGRGFIQRCDVEFDIIELSMAYSASASSAGIYALHENYMFTVESFKAFMFHLSENGFLSVSRWLLPPPREDIRIVALAISALQDMGVSDPHEHIVVLRSWGTITLIVKKSPFKPGDIQTIEDFCGKMSFDIVYFPGVEPSEVNVYNIFPEPIYYNIVSEMLHAEDKAKFYNSYLYDIKPATDERPFFFHFFKWNRLLETYESMGGKWQPLIEGGYLVPIALIQASGLSVLFILLPLRRVDKKKISYWSFIVYFFCLGLGYMFIEVAIIQKFILLLGHPVYSVSAVLFSLLISSGLGSYISNAVKPTGFCHKFLLLTIAVIAPLYGLVSPFLRTLLGLSMATRFLVTPLIISPLGLLLGIPFPLGVKMLSNFEKELIPWAWAANGCASVIGSILPMIIALHFGFSLILLVSGAVYLVGLWTIILMKQK